jgi:HD-GYP domain-containing protein (c-di-GMP phosphodiesterase class II)
LIASRKKISAVDLRIGMEVVDLDRPWLETPFLYQGFLITHQGQIDELNRYCREVVVLAEENELDILARMSTPTASADTPTLAAKAAYVRQNEIDQALLKINNRPNASPLYEDRTTLEQEIKTVRDTFKQAREISRALQEDARYNRPLKAAVAKQAVGEMVESILRNPDALACYTQLKKKDEYAAQHGLRCAVYALTLGRHLGFDRETLNALGLGALLIDVGKAKVPSEILNKTEPLTEIERAVLRRHVAHGIEILEKQPSIPKPSLEVVAKHHENYAGGGYPNNLKGDEIGTFGLIGAIVDWYDAVTCDRPYRAGLAPHEGLRRLFEERGKSLQPQLVEHFIQALGIYPIGSMVELSNGEVGVVAAMNRARRLKPRVALALKTNRAPYVPAPMVDLMTYQTRDGKSVEIERVLPPNTYQLEPAWFLPVH